MRVLFVDTAKFGVWEVHCYPSLGRFGLESLALLGSGGLVSPAEIANIIGGMLPIAL